MVVRACRCGWCGGGGSGSGSSGDHDGWVELVLLLLVSLSYDDTIESSA